MEDANFGKGPIKLLVIVNDLSNSNFTTFLKKNCKKYPNTGIFVVNALGLTAKKIEELEKINKKPFCCVIDNTVDSSNIYGYGNYVDVVAKDANLKFSRKKKIEGEIAEWFMNRYNLIFLCIGKNYLFSESDMNKLFYYFNGRKK